MPNKPLSRRYLLRGAGVSLALPLLNCMLPQSVRAANTIAAPRRSVFIYLPNGVNPLTWQIESAGSGYQMPDVCKSLEPLRDEITPISGLHHPGGIGKAHQCDLIWLTGAPISEGRFRNSVSVDQVMAHKVGMQTRFPSLELTITGGSLAWTPEGTQLPAEGRPRVLFEKLFGTGNGQDAAAAREALARRKSVLDFLLEDSSDFNRKLGREDRATMDEYLTAVRRLERQTSAAARWLNVPKPQVSSDDRDHLCRNIPKTDAGDYYRTIYDLMALALQTDSTRVITCMSGSESLGLALPEIGINQTRHELSHHNGDPGQMRKLTRTDEFLVEQFAYFLKRLQSVTEQGESLLDRTMVLFGSGMSYGNSHGNANLPLILAGGASLGLKHGKHLDFNLPVIDSYCLDDPMAHYRLCTQPIDDNARLSNLLLTMLRRMQIDVPAFADSIDELSGV